MRDERRERRVEYTEGELGREGKVMSAVPARWNASRSLTFAPTFDMCTAAGYLHSHIGQHCRAMMTMMILAEQERPEQSGSKRRPCVEGEGTSRRRIRRKAAPRPRRHHHRRPLASCTEHWRRGRSSGGAPANGRWPGSEKPPVFSTHGTVVEATPLATLAASCAAE